MYVSILTVNLTLLFVLCWRWKTMHFNWQPFLQCRDWILLIGWSNSYFCNETVYLLHLWLLVFVHVFMHKTKKTFAHFIIIGACIFSRVFVPLPLPVSIPFEKQLNFIHRTLQVAPMLMSAICYCVYSNVVSMRGELHSESIDIVIRIKKNIKEKLQGKKKKRVSIAFKS